MRTLSGVHNIEDLRRKARRRLPRAVFEVVDGGTGDEHTLAANRADLARLTLRPRSLVDVTGVDTAATILGRRMATPFLLAPCSMGRMCDPAAERAVAAAAGAHGVGYVAPGGASESVEDIAAAAGGPLWYQIYLAPDEAHNDATLDRVAAAGYEVLVVSVDTPMKPYRERDLRNGLTLPVTITPKMMLAAASRPRWAKDFVFGSMAAGFSLRGAQQAVYNFETAMSHLRPVTLADVHRLRARWAGPLVVKGLLNNDRIAELVDAGVDAVCVSNHGGRNVDGVVSTVSALPRIVDAAAGRMEVLMDGGVRRGVDVVRALAMGASGVLVGRPYMYGLAAAGQVGVERAITLLRDELRVTLAMLGCRGPADVGPDLLADRDRPAGPTARAASRTDRYLDVVVGGTGDHDHRPPAERSTPR